MKIFIMMIIGGLLCSCIDFGKSNGDFLLKTAFRKRDLNRILALVDGCNDPNIISPGDLSFLIRDHGDIAYDIITIFIEKGYSIDNTSHGSTLLMFAAQYGRDRIVDLVTHLFDFKK